MLIEEKEQFQPSTEALEKWLATRKSSINVGGVTMPQFFSDKGNSADSTWFFIAVIGELVGLVVTVWGGFKNGGVFLIFATLSIIMFIFVDFFFAVKLHRNKSKICKIHTLILLLDDAKKAALAKLKQQLQKGKFADFLLISGIILLALFKVIGVVLLGVFNNLILYLPVAIVYFIVAYIHIMHTGYYFAYTAAQKRIDKDFAEFADGRHQAQEFRQPVVLQSELNDLPIKHYPHQIIVNPNVTAKQKNPDDYHYLIVAKGILTDSDITSLVAGQDSQTKITLFKACRELQVQSYGVTF